MINPRHFRHLVIRPSLKLVQMWSPWAEELLFGTAMAESGLQHLQQLGGGPALGLYQMEPATYHDIWDNYLQYRQHLAIRVRHFSRQRTGGPRPEPEEMITNLAFATVMARIHYYRQSFQIPNQGDVGAMSRIWKTHYNTHLGAGTHDHFMTAYNQGTLAMDQMIV